MDEQVYTFKNAPVRHVFLVTQHRAYEGKLRPENGHSLFDVVSVHSTKDQAEAARSAAEEAYLEKFPGYRDPGRDMLRLWAVQRMDLNPHPAQRPAR